MKAYDFIGENLSINDLFEICDESAKYLSFTEHRSMYHNNAEMLYAFYEEMKSYFVIESRREDCFIIMK